MDAIYDDWQRPRIVLSAKVVIVMKRALWLVWATSLSIPIVIIVLDMMLQHAGKHEWPKPVYWVGVFCIPCVAGLATARLAKKAPMALRVMLAIAWIVVVPVEVFFAMLLSWLYSGMPMPDQ